MSWLGTECSHIGERQEQQDALTILYGHRNASFLAVLADGAGGHQGGRLASQAVVAVAKEVWESSGGHVEDPKAFLLDLFNRAQNRIGGITKETGLEPRATVVAVYADDRQAVWGHSGDSRLYLFRDGEFVQRTLDHSVVQILVDRGKVREEEMGTHPDQGRLLQSLGGEEYQVPDIGGAPILGGEVFVLCSDGFWEHLPREAIAKLTATQKIHPPRMIRKLAETAVHRAGRKADNTSALAVYNRAGTGRASFSALGNQQNLQLAAVVLLAVLLLGLVYLNLPRPQSEPEHVQPTTHQTKTSVFPVENPEIPHPETSPQQPMSPAPLVDANGSLDPRTGRDAREGALDRLTKGDALPNSPIIPNRISSSHLPQDSPVVSASEAAGEGEQEADHAGNPSEPSAPTESKTEGEEHELETPGKEPGLVRKIIRRLRRPLAY